MNPVQRALNDSDRCQDVVSHRLIFCESALRMPTEDLIDECFCCHRFLAFCCACTERQREKERRSRYFLTEPVKPCHYYKLLFVDGSCINDGQGSATSGVGIALGTGHPMQWAIPINDSIHTSQRAELHAALHGLHLMANHEARGNDDSEKEHNGEKVTWVVASDSEYVVSGMTEWVPSWKRNGWRNPHGRRPKNIDLFQSLDAAVEQFEREQGVRIAFWWISREYYQLADSLAGLASRWDSTMAVADSESSFRV